MPTTLLGAGVAILPVMAAPASGQDGATYPAEALRQRQEGAVVLALTVGIDGRVTNCTVTRSSGALSLDAESCRIMTARARYKLATDPDGHAIASTATQTIHWKLPAR